MTEHAVAVQSASDMIRLLVQIKYALLAFLHSRPFEIWRDVLSVSRVYSNILKSERSTLTDSTIRSAKKLVVERQRQWVWV